MTEWVADPKTGEKKNIRAHKFTIQTKQVFHLKNTYTYVYEWLLEEGFESETEDDKYETMYDEKIAPDGGRVIRAWWRSTMDPDNNSYYRYRLNIFYEINGIKKTEAMFKGRKIKADNGEIFIHGEAILELDYKNMFKAGLLLRLSKWFRLRLYKKQREYYEEDLRRRATRLQEDMKRILEIQNYEKYPESFHDIKGF